MPTMPEALDYAPPRKSYARYALFILTAATLCTSYALAIPRLKIYRQHQIRRHEIRDHFEAQLDRAHGALNQRDVDTAALALLHAEFQVRTERHLFSRSQMANFDRELEGIRVPFRVAAMRQLEEWQREAEIREKRIREEGLRVCYSSDADRFKTLDALTRRAAEALKGGNNKCALAICEQIVALAPRRQFDSAFWANTPE